MTITITLPTGVTVIGPAGPITATSSIADPQGAPFQWRLTLKDQSNEVTYFSTIVTSPVGTQNTFRLLYNPDGTPSAVAYPFTLDVNTPVRINVDLLADSGVTIDTSTPITAPWNPVPFLHQDLFLQTRPAGSAGFTPSDRELLEHIDSAVWMPWPNG